MAMLFPRPGELRAAKWEEFDFESSVWIIPEARMKMRRPHRVPLSKQAVSVLTSLKEITGGGSLPFPSVRSDSRPISDNTLNAALRRMGYGKEEATAHGFRATASTLLNECGKWHPDAIERQLAHIENNDVRRAYARAEHWEERVNMMQWWADYLDELESKSARVISIGGHGKPAIRTPSRGTAMNPTATVHRTTAPPERAATVTTRKGCCAKGRSRMAGTA